MSKFITALQKRLQQPLPGISAQVKMMNSTVNDKVNNNRFQVPDNHRKASVLAMLYSKSDVWHFALIQRPESAKHHKSQISFPGGKIEKEDPDPSYAACRETEEELGIPREKIQILGQLTQLYIPVSNFLVQPFVGYLPNLPEFNPNPREVDEVIEIKLQDLLDYNNRKKTDIALTESLKINEVPHFYIDNKVIWGATAMMLSELSEIIDFSY
jgi:8-oxo-dGTP pyrophosphatase MutT (NUDIX family)